MSVLDGYNKYKRYIKTNDGYKLCSQWTSSNTVQMDDGNTLQTNLGAINGITDSLTATSSNIAASAAAVKTLNDNLNNYLPLSGGTITGIISGSSGGKFSYDGNVYLKADGYDGWLSTIIHYKTDIGYPSISFVEKYSYSGQFFAENSKVIINGRFIYDGVFQAHNWYVIGYIQDGYRPGFPIHASASVISNDSVSIGSALICIEQDGAIKYYSEIPGFCIDTSITFKV